MWWGLYRLLYFAGTAKAVMAARFTQDFGKCVGIEILPSLHKQASIIVDRYIPQLIYRLHIYLIYAIFTDSKLTTQMYCLLDSTRTLRFTRYLCLQTYSMPSTITCPIFISHLTRIVWIRDHFWTMIGQTATSFSQTRRALTKDSWTI